MIYSQEFLLNYLKDNQISYKFYSHPPLFTSEQAKECLANLDIPGMGVKNLFLKDSKKKLWLIVAAYTTKIDLKKTGKLLSAKELRFAEAALLVQHLGVEPGSVTPLALINDQEKIVHVIIDAALINEEFIQVHPLKNDATVVITPSALLSFLQINDRRYQIIDFKDFI